MSSPPLNGSMTALGQEAKHNPAGAESGLAPKADIWVHVPAWQLWANFEGMSGDILAILVEANKGGLSRGTSGKSRHSRLPEFAFVHPSREKYFAFTETQIRCRVLPSHPGKRGGRDRHERGARCGGRRCAFDEGRRRGRRSRVVPTPRRWCQVAQDLSRVATVARKPGSPRRARYKS